MADAAIARLSPSPVVIGGLGLAWNLFGVYRFISTAFADEAQHLAAGMTPSQAAMYVNLPVWMDIAFAAGVFGGCAGCVLLLLAQRRLAAAVFLASLTGYLVLYVGDIALGVFAAFGAPQIVILTLVVAIAAALFFYAARMSRGIAHA